MDPGDSRMKRPQKSELAEHWSLDPSVTFLNHGSFGATPNVVLEEQSRIRLQIERDPVRFFERDFIGKLELSRDSLCGFLNADPHGMA